MFVFTFIALLYILRESARVVVKKVSSPKLNIEIVKQRYNFIRVHTKKTKGKH